MSLSSAPLPGEPDQPEDRLAIRGGRPVREPPLHFHQASVGPEELEELRLTLESRWLTTGPRTGELERRFAELVGAPHAVATSSCTAAMHLALLGLGVGPGQEVITSPITFAATGNVIVHTGATPVFADVDRDTLCLDPAKVEQALTERTAAILAVHLAGHPVDLDPLEEMARCVGVPLIVDAAHAIETTYRGRPSGTHGHAVAYSFYATKNITTAEGGMLVTADPELAERARVLALHGLSRGAYGRYEPGRFVSYSVVEAGYKYNMDDLHAAVGVRQLDRLEGFLERRRQLVARYDAGLAQLEHVTPLGRREYATRHAHHLYVVLLDLQALGASRDEIAGALVAEGIGVGIHFKALHLEPFYVRTFGCRPGTYPVAEWAGQRVLSLPLYPALQDEDVDQVLHALARVLRGIRSGAAG
jgi:dTDP-4-amino-4,6-dideoxygalactose transaminase